MLVSFELLYVFIELEVDLHVFSQLALLPPSTRNFSVYVFRFALISHCAMGAFIVSSRSSGPLLLKRSATLKTHGKTCRIKFNFSNTTSSRPKAYYPAIKEMFSILFPSCSTMCLIFVIHKT